MDRDGAGLGSWVVSELLQKKQHSLSVPSWGEWRFVQPARPHGQQQGPQPSEGVGLTWLNSAHVDTSLQFGETSVTSWRYSHVVGEVPGRLGTLLPLQRCWMHVADPAGPTKPGHKHCWLAPGLCFPAAVVVGWVPHVPAVFGPPFSGG